MFEFFMNTYTLLEQITINYAMIHHIALTPDNIVSVFCQMLTRR
jgi:hypothetical protein